MRFEISNHDVDTAGLELMRLIEHLISLTHAGGVSEEYFEMAPAAAGQRSAHCGNTRTSILSALANRRSTGVLVSLLSQPRRCVCPMKI